MANIIKKTVIKLMDKVLLSTGYVLEVRKWQPETIHEVDLHLPETDMSKWITIPRIKCKVAEFAYRDYTPARWDAEKRTCTVLIETGHNGDGSRWTQNLQAGDTIGYAAAHAAGLPAKPGKVSCFGDGSAVGHFLALKQLTNRDQFPLEVVIFFNEVYALPQSLINENPEFQFIMQPDGSSLDGLRDFSTQKAWVDDATVYVAGYIPMVQGLRKTLRQTRNFQAKIFAQGFWS